MSLSMLGLEFPRLALKLLEPQVVHQDPYCWSERNYENLYHSYIFYRWVIHAISKLVYYDDINYTLATFTQKNNWSILHRKFFCTSIISLLKWWWEIPFSLPNNDPNWGWCESTFLIAALNWTFLSIKWWESILIYWLHLGSFCLHKLLIIMLKWPILEKAS